MKVRKFTRKTLNISDKQIIGYHRYPLNFLRKLPDFLILGAQKAATSSLYYYLSQHPQLEASCVKEPQYFNMNFDRGPAYYKSHFPIHVTGRQVYEGSPDYFSHPLAPERCFRLLPNIKMIVCLRNPIDRAVSHYQFVKSYGGEDLSMDFEKALELEERRLNDAFSKINSNKIDSAAAIARYGYKHNGEYAKHLKSWLKFYSLENFLFLDFNNLKSDPLNVLEKIFEFVGIQDAPIEISSIKNKTKITEPISSTTLVNLKEHYSTGNKELFQIIGRNYNW